MSSDQHSYLTAIELEEARLRERLEKLAQFKKLAVELGIDVANPVAPRAVSPERATADTSPAVVAAIPPEPDSRATPSFDGTFNGLIDSYRTHADSPYHKLKHSVRRNYDQGINRISKEMGADFIREWNATRIQQAYDTNWASNGRVAMGQSIIGKLRLLTSFGSVVLNNDDCTRLSTIIGNMRFPVPPKRTEVLTYAHARAIRATARNQFAWPSIALAQAFQFEIPKLHQVDILGQWVPLSEPGESDISNGSEKWVGGLRWSDIDENMILRREFESGRQRGTKVIHTDLKRFAMIMEEINAVPSWQRDGPLVRCEFSGIPWVGSEFRRKWRIVADKAGVPSNVKITDGARGNNESFEKQQIDVFE